MPMHDWTRVSAGTYHDFHCRWLADLTNRLNDGLLPDDHYAQVEQVMEGMISDILTLQTDDLPEVSSGNGTPQEGGVAVAVTPPRVRFTESLDSDLYASLARHITIRHSSDDRMVALIELVSPGTKGSEYAFQTFLDKTLAALTQGYHLVVIDPFPPTPRDPAGIHGAIWAKLGKLYQPPGDKPLTLAAYASGLKKTAYVDPIAVGDSLTPMPLFLRPERYVPLPLEESYLAIFRVLPPRWRRVLAAGAG